MIIQEQPSNSLAMRFLPHLNLLLPIKFVAITLLVVAPMAHIRHAEVMALNPSPLCVTQLIRVAGYYGAVIGTTVLTWRFPSQGKYLSVAVYHIDGLVVLTSTHPSYVYERMPPSYQPICTKLLSADQQPKIVS